MQAKIAARTISIDPALAWQALRHEVAHQSRPLRLWLGFLACLMAFGAWGAASAILPGAKGFGTTPAFEWGLLIAAYVFFAVTTSGLCLASSLGTVFGIEMFLPLEKRHAILAVLFLCTAFGVIAMELQYPLRIAFGVVLSPSPHSAMWWMGVLYGIYLGFLLTEVWSMFTGHPRVHRVACVLSSMMAVFAPATLGAVFGLLGSRPFWSGAFTPVYLVETAFLSGVALLGIVFYFVQRLRLSGYGHEAERAIAGIRILLACAVGLAMVLVTVKMVAGYVSSDPGSTDATVALLVGPLALPFWVLKISVGLVIPLALLVLPRWRTNRGLLIASISAFVGIFADRLIFVAAGQIAPASAASGIVSQPFATYTPSLGEIAIVAGAFGLVGFLYTLAERFLDLRQHDDHGRHPAAHVAAEQAGAAL